MSEVLNLIGKYDKFGLDLEGSSESLRELATKLVSHDIEKHKTFPLTVPSAAPSPYLGYAKSLKVELDQGSVCVSRDGDQITITGSADKLAILAGNIEAFANEERGARLRSYKGHLHIEYHPGHFYLRQGSIPLVVAMQPSD